MDSQRSRDRLARGFLFGTIGLLSIGLGRVAQLQLAPAEELGRLVGERARTDRILAFRGNIEDRHGRILAMSTMGADLAVDVKFLLQQARETGGPEDPIPPVAGALAEFTGLDEATLLDLLRKRRNDRYVVIARAETLSVGGGEAKVREWRSRGIPGADGRPWGPVPGIVLDSRSFRRTTDGSSASA
ncbi:MAG: hypothetical protein VX672_10250, partial [Planctomycetota bacterium]|nr:hypothetical protein [Planctomycetota bacterium]